ncbi:MAG TPA: HPr family phosphocarrier protein [bacterium]|nr:HPr family phosphocarrier protein [bacterium]HEX67822.1 HPr family phosphocarrier protein [bacterium]
MLEKEVIIGNPLGLHARPAAKFVKLSQGFSSEVYLEKNGERVSGKSILEVLMLAAEKGERIKIIVDGKDEEEALKVLTRFLEGKEEI